MGEGNTGAGGNSTHSMANNGLSVRFDLISINQLAVRKLSKRANFPFCWRRFVALEKAVAVAVAPHMFVGQ